MLRNSGIRTFVIDMDGVICSMESYPNYVRAIPKTPIINKMNQLYEIGHRIIIYTARYEEDRSITKKWLETNSVKYHELVMNKPQGDFYIDDLNLVVDDWLLNEYPIERFLLIDWNRFVEDVVSLCRKLPNDISGVFGVPRKGLIPAVIVSLVLAKKLTNTNDISDTDLIVDDVVDTGNTVSIVKQEYPRNRIASVYVSEKSKHLVDYYSTELNTEEYDRKGVFVLMPWESVLLPDEFNPPLDLSDKGFLNEYIARELYKKGKFDKL